VAQRYTTARRVIDIAESNQSGASVFSGEAFRPFGSLYRFEDEDDDEYEVC
jgi:hypothetical protein